MKPADLRTQESNAISAEQVRAYLAEHPEFFIDHAELLEVLKVPHHTGSAVSLVEKQLTIYREKNEKLSRQLDVLVQIARDNDKLFHKMHNLTLALMDAGDLESTIAGLQSVLHDQFNADFVSIRIAQDHDASPLADIFVPAGDERLESFGKIISSRRPRCGSPSSQHAAFLFGDNAEKVKSCAIIPFFAAEVIGLLGIGSANQERFLPSMGHMFLSQIGEMIGYRLGPMLPRPA